MMSIIVIVIYHRHKPAELSRSDVEEEAEEQVMRSRFSLATFRMYA
jgi:hypothetical protein